LSLGNFLLLLLLLGPDSPSLSLQEADSGIIRGTESQNEFGLWDGGDFQPSGLQSEFCDGGANFFMPVGVRDRELSSPACKFAPNPLYN